MIIQRTRRRTVSEDRSRSPGRCAPRCARWLRSTDAVRTEAFANFYRDVADEVKARRDGLPSTIRELSFPTGRDGLLGVQFVEAVAASHAQDGAWVSPGAPQKPTSTDARN